MRVYIKDGYVAEVIQELDPAFPDVPFEARFAPDFVSKCVQIPDDTEVHSGWIWNESERKFEAPAEPMEELEDTDSIPDAVAVAELLEVLNEQGRT